MDQVANPGLANNTITRKGVIHLIGEFYSELILDDFRYCDGMILERRGHDESLARVMGGVMGRQIYEGLAPELES